MRAKSKPQLKLNACWDQMRPSPPHSAASNSPTCPVRRRGRRAWKSKAKETWAKGNNIYLITKSSVALPCEDGRGFGVCQPTSLFLGLLTSHHVPLGHIEGRGVTIRIGGVFKQD